MKNPVFKILLPAIALMWLTALPAAAQQDDNQRTLPSIFDEKKGVEDFTPSMELMPRDLVPLEGALDRDKYILGPGDWLQFSIWGTSMPLNQNLYVSSEGRLLVPLEGAVQVAGMSLAAAEHLIKERLQAYYTTSLTVTLTLGNPRSFRVYVAGAVLAPGSYKATGLDRISDLIQLAGGIRTGGSYRRIKMSDSQGNLIREVDLMGYLSNADMEQNPTLNDGVVVEVPSVDNYVTLSGEFPNVYGIDSVRINNIVKEPETRYRVEFLPGESLLDVLKFTGEPQMPDTSLVGNVMVSDKLPGAGEMVPLTAEMLAEPLIKGRYYTFPVRNNWVYVSGAVTVSGRYQYHPGWLVQDYLGQAGGPNWNGSKKVYLRKTGSDEEIKAGLNDPVYPGDAIFVPEKFHPERYLAVAAGLVGTIIIVVFR